MKAYKILSALFFAIVLFEGCEKEKMILSNPSGVVLMAWPEQIARPMTYAGDLPDEYDIKDLSIFLANVGSGTFTDRFIHQSFSSADDASLLGCKLASLSSLNPAMVGRKDVYVVANCTDVAALNAIGTVSDLNALKTPVATAAAGLTTAAGLPMYGQVLNADLSQTTKSSPLTVSLLRTCAKFQVTVIFADNTWIGIDNAFEIENVAPYTFYVKRDTLTLFDATDLVSYPQIELLPVATQQYRNVTYLYEARQLPQMHYYTTLNGVARSFVISSQYPLPVRNHLYDIQIRMLSPLSARAASVEMGDMNCQVTVRTYDSQGIETFSAEYFDALH